MSYDEAQGPTPFLHETAGGFVQVPSPEDMPSPEHEGPGLRDYAMPIVAAASFGVASIAGAGIRADFAAELTDLTHAATDAAAAINSGLDYVSVQIDGSTTSGAPEMVQQDIASRIGHVTEVNTVMSPLTWVATAGTAALTLYFVNSLVKASGGWKSLPHYLLPRR